MDVWAARYSQSQVSLATGVQRNRLAMWLNRGYVKYAEVDGDRDTGTGVAHQVSARTALRIAILGAVSPFIDPNQAGPAVVKFMDSGKTATQESPDTREPGGLFEEGETVLCVYDDGAADVFCIRADTLATALPNFRSGRCAALIPMDELHSTVLGRLERMTSSPAELVAAVPAKQREPADG